MNTLWFKTRQIRFHRKVFYIFSLVWIVYMQSCCSSVIKELHAWNYYLSSRMNHLFALTITFWLQDIVSESENMNSFTVFQIKVNSPMCILGMSEVFDTLAWLLQPRPPCIYRDIYQKRSMQMKYSRWCGPQQLKDWGCTCSFIKLCVRAANLRPWRKVRRHEPAG